MEAAQAYPDICGGESRSYVNMEGTLEDFAALFEKRMAEPGKQASGRRLELSNDQEWYLWTLRDHCTLRTFADDLKIGRDKISDTLKRLKDQGGPQGKRPKWMK